MISEKALAEFKKIFKEEKGTELSDEEAMEEAVALLTLFNVVYRPIKKSWLEEFEKEENAKHRTVQKTD